MPAIDPLRAFGRRPSTRATCETCSIFSAIADNYAAQDPAVVAAQLTAAGAALADSFDAVPTDAWDRTGRRDNGSEFNVVTLGQYCLHDVVHHLHDVGA